MKKVLASALLVSAAALSGCATSFPMGNILTDVTLPHSATSNSAATKTGEATCKSILGMVATGDCSIEAAKKAGGIKTVSSVDFKANNILGVIGTYTTIVKGK